jgi:hypothetical protein
MYAQVAMYAPRWLCMPQEALYAPGGYVCPIRLCMLQVARWRTSQVAMFALMGGGWESDCIIVSCVVRESIR